MGGMGMDTPLCWQPTRGMWGSMIYTQRGRRGGSHDTRKRKHTFMHRHAGAYGEGAYTHRNACTLQSSFVF